LFLLALLVSRDPLDVMTITHSSSDHVPRACAGLALTWLITIARPKESKAANNKRLGMLRHSFSC
jgi:hypothetical protein